MSIVELKDLPAFHVREVRLDGPDPRLVGHFSHLQGVCEDRSWLYAGDLSVIGDVTELNERTLSAVFVAPFWTHDSPVQIGSIAPWIAGCWQAYEVTMIIAPDATWRRESFVASDAQHYRQGESHGWTKIGSAPTGAVLTFAEPGGWDHEECRICDSHIGRGGLPFGFVSPAEMWICNDCYERYASKRSLAFLLGL
jgi:hypothetical protein